MHRAIIWLSVGIVIAVAVAWFVGTVRAPLKHEVAQAKAQASAVQEARNTEQATVKNDVSTSKTYQDGLNEGKKELNAAIAKLRAERVRYHSPIAAGVPENPSASCGCNDEEGAVISEEVARIGAEADDVARQLTAAQELLGNRK